MHSKPYTGPRHSRDMTEKLWKATLNPNTHTQTHSKPKYWTVWCKHFMIERFLSKVVSRITHYLLFVSSFVFFFQLCCKVFVCVYSGLTSLSTVFQSYHDGVWLWWELNAHFYSAASLKYHVPDTWHDTTPSHIILTLGRPVLALPCKSECQTSSS